MTAVQAKLTAEQKATVENNIEWCRGVVHNIVKYVPCGSLWEMSDAEQLGYLAMCEAVRNFDRTKSSFRTYAARSIYITLSKLFKNTSDMMAFFDYSSSFENGEILSGNGRGSSLISGYCPDACTRSSVKVGNAVSEESARKFRHEYRTAEINSGISDLLSDSSLSPLEKQAVEIAYLFAEGYPQVKIAEKYGLSQQVISQRKHRGLSIIKKKVLEN